MLTVTRINTSHDDNKANIAGGGGDGGWEWEVGVGGGGVCVGGERGN